MESHRTYSSSSPGPTRSSVSRPPLATRSQNSRMTTGLWLATAHSATLRGPCRPASPGQTSGRSALRLPLRAAGLGRRDHELLHGRDQHVRDPLAVHAVG
jgi:hypothetical protein